MSNKQVILAAAVVGIMIAAYYYYDTIYKYTIAPILTLTAAENAPAVVTCPTGNVHLTGATWMVPDGACASTNILAQAQSGCTGPSCSFATTTANFGEICQNHVKQLQMQYQCV